MLIKTSQGFLIDSASLVFKREDQWFLHLVDFFDKTGLALNFSDELLEGEGFIIREERVFRINFKECFFEVERKRESFPCESFFVDLDGVYLNTEVIERFLPMSIMVEPLRSEIILKTYEDLPPVAAQKRDGKERTQGSYEEVLEEVEIERSWLDGFNLDQDIRTRYQKRGDIGETRTQHQTILSAEVLKSEFYAQYLGEDGKQQAYWLGLERNDHRGRIFGDVGLSQVKAYHFNSPNLNLIGGSRKIRGVSLTNRPIHLPSQFTRQDFVGPLEQGWEVELYQNDIFIGRDVGSADRQRYEFLGVELFYGVNFFHFIFYGPRGEIRHSYQTLNIDQIFQGGDLPLVSASLGEDDDGNTYRYAELDFLVANRFFLESYTTTFTNRQGKEKAYYGLGVNTFISGAVLKMHGAWDDQGAAYQADMRFNPFRSMNASLTYLKAENFQSEVVGRNREVREELDFQALFPVSFIPRLQVLAELSRTNYADANPDWYQRLRLSYSYQRFFIFNTYELSRRGYLNETILRYSWRGHQLRAGHKLDKIGPINSFAVLSLKQRDLYQFSATYDYLHHSETSVYGLRADRYFKGLNLGLEANYNSNQDLSLSLNLSFGLSYDREMGAHFTHDRQSNYGNARVQSFIDQNDNGLYDANEPALPNVTYRRLSDRHEQLSDEQGQVFFTRVPAAQPTGIRASTHTTDNVYLRPKHNGVRFWGRRGKTAVIDYPFIYAGDVEGEVLFGEWSGKWRDFQGTLTRKKDGLSYEFKVERDGYFLVQAVRPGDYELVVRCTSCGEGLLLNRTLSMDEEGDSLFLEQLSFYTEEEL